MGTEIKTGFLNSVAMSLVVTIALGAVSFAQNQTKEGKRIAKGEMESIWKLQALSVSDQLGLSKDQSTKLTTAYLSARARHKQTLKELPEEKDKDKSRAALQAAIGKDQAKFLSDLKGKLTADVLAKITMTLGSFNARWDGYTAELLGLKLDKEKMKAAMGFLIGYVSDYEGASKESLKSFNRRPNSRSFKDKLDTDLAGVLSAEQMTQWKAATAMSGAKGKDAGGEKK